MSLTLNFIEAHRRVCISKKSVQTKERSKLWIGLTVPSDMKEMKKKGYVVPHGGRETPRVLNWYLFTDAGWAKYDTIFKDAPDYFAKEFESFVVVVNKEI